MHFTSGHDDARTSWVAAHTLTGVRDRRDRCRSGSAHSHRAHSHRGYVISLID